jgi:LysM repeat protein
MWSMDRTNVRWGRIVGLAVGVMLAVSAMAARVNAKPAQIAPAAERTYVVQPGDTLWRIAVRSSAAGADPRPLVQRLIDLNQLGGGSIVPGQLLALP